MNSIASLMNMNARCLGWGLGMRVGAMLTMATVTTVPAADNLDWPQWRGPDRSDVSKETGLLKSWPAGGPKKVWMFENAGKGYAGFSVVKGRLYTMGTRTNSEVLLSLDASTGQEQWVTTLAGMLNNDWGDGPRGTPTVNGDNVYVMSGNGTLVCVQASDGKIVWKKKMSELGGRTPGWGYTESPLVDGDLVVCTPGGSKGALAAFDKKTGDLKWQSKDFTDEAQYASIVPADLNGTRQYIQLTMKSVAGLAAADGKLLWRHNWPGQTAVIPTPVYQDGHVYVTSGYGAGCMLLKIGDGNQVTGIYTNKVMKNHHGGVVLIGDHIYGNADPGWICQNLKTGEEVWSHRDFGKGAISSADGMLYCLEENSGTVALIEASPAGWSEKGRMKLEPQSKIRSSRGKIWTHPVISNGRLYLRDQDLIFCYDVKGA
jgi:outer membrane protein assembly factor BamB